MWREWIKRKTYISLDIRENLFIFSNSNNYQKTKKSRTYALDLGDYEKEKF